MPRKYSLIKVFKNRFLYNRGDSRAQYLILIVASKTELSYGSNMGLQVNHAKINVPFVSFKFVSNLCDFYKIFGHYFVHSRRMRNFIQENWDDNHFWTSCQL